MIQPDKVWAGDITYIATDEGWLFLAVVIDLFSRQVVGWSLRQDMTRDIVIDALRCAALRMMAWFKRHPGKHTGLIFHSVRGSQYLSIRYSERLAEAGIQPSVGSKGLLRQRTGRDHQRAVQGRVNSPPESLEEQGIRGAGHPAMGALVQPHPTAQADWGNTSGRS